MPETSSRLLEILRGLFKLDRCQKPLPQAVLELPTRCSLPTPPRWALA